MSDPIARVVTDSAFQEEPLGNLFSGLKFFITQRVPMRSHYIGLVKNNGGQISILEKNADHVIVDHARKNIMPGGVSFRFIEECIKNNKVVDSAPFMVGRLLGSPGDDRTLQLASSTRKPFTASDDRILWKWVEQCQARGGAVQGNEIYKLLEQNNPQHPWQSWRNRFVKYLVNKPPIMNPLLSPPTELSDDSTLPVGFSAKPAETVQGAVINEKRQRNRKGNQSSTQVDSASRNKFSFTQIQYENLYINAQAIFDCRGPDYLKGWQSWAASCYESYGDVHTPDDWRVFFEDYVLPTWEKDKKEGTMDAKTREYRAKELTIESDATAELAEPTEEIYVAENPASVQRSGSHEAEERSDEEALFVTQRNVLKGKRHLSMSAKEDKLSWQGQQDRLPSKGLRMPTMMETVNYEMQTNGVEVEPLLGPSYGGSNVKRRRINDEIENHAKATMIRDAQILDKDHSGLAIKSRPIIEIDMSENDLSDDFSRNGIRPYAENVDEVAVHQEPQPHPASNLKINEIEITPQGFYEGADRNEPATVDPDAETAWDTTNSDFGIFELPLPDDGWGDGPSTPLHRSETSHYRPHLSAFNTQKILGADSQTPDLSFPPSFGETDETQQEKNEMRKHSTHTDTEEPLDAEGLASFLTEMTKLGYRNESIKKALHCTSLNEPLARETIEYIELGSGVPKNMKGVWTEEDEQDYLGGDARRMKRVTEKHGWKACELRVDFLRQMNT